MSYEAPACFDTVHHSANTFYPPVSRHRKAGRPPGNLWELLPVESFSCPTPPDMRAGVLWKNKIRIHTLCFQTQDIHGR